MSTSQVIRSFGDDFNGVHRCGPIRQSDRSIDRTNFSPGCMTWSPVAHTRTRAARISIPNTWLRCCCAATVVGYGTPTATSSSSSAWGCARSLLGTGIEPVVDAVRAVARRWSQLHPADGPRTRRGRGFPRPRAWRRHGQVREERIRRHHSGRPAGPAATGRVKVAVCGDQPFFSTDDWFIGTTDMAGGIPSSSREATVRFSYNDLESLSTALAKDDVACVILEAATADGEPEQGFLEGVRKLCDRHGTVLIFDEMITGFRWSARGAQAVYGVRPDLSRWGKAMGNGFPLSALAGKREFMELGGLRTDRERVFLLSTTHGAEAVSLAAFRAVVKAYAHDEPVRRMEHAGQLLADGVEAAVRAEGLGEYVQVTGRPSCLTFATRDSDGKPSQAYRTLFLQELLDRGVLGQSFVTSAAHTDLDIGLTVDAVRGALPMYRRAIEQGSVEGLLNGRPVAPALRRFAAPRRIEADATTGRLSTGA